MNKMAFVYRWLNNNDLTFRKHFTGHFLKLYFWVNFVLILTNTVSAEQLYHVNDTLYEGKLIDSIVIDNRNIYDITQEQYDKFLFKTANKIHQTTQKKSIEREILLVKGTQFSQDLADETARILRQRFVLYDAWIENEIYDGSKLLVRIITIDRWSLSIGAELKREGNENEFRVGVLEKNLFGQNRLISYYYINKSDDDNYSEASFVDKRLFGLKLVGDIDFSTNPIDKFTKLSLSKPFFNLKDQFEYGISTLKKSGRIDYYTDDSLISQSFYRGSRFEADIKYRLGSYKKKYSYRLNYIYNYETNNSSSLLTGSVQDTTYHAIKNGVSYSTYYYKKKFNIDGFNYTEDFNTGIEINFDYQNVYSVKKIKKLYDVFYISFRKNFITPNTLSSFQSVYIDWINSDGTLRKSRGFNIKYYNQSIEKINFAFNIDYWSDRSPVQSRDLVQLGGTNGLRGVDKNFLTGDERILINTEMRVLPMVTILSFHFGMAIFTDIANIMQAEEDFKLSKTYTSFGTGLRIAFDRSSKNIIRLDFAYTRNNSWQLSLGTGQYFYASSQY